MARVRDAVEDAVVNQLAQTWEKPNLVRVK